MKTDTEKEIHLFKKLRKKHKLTQKMFADKIGFTQSHVSRIESGKKNINMKMALSLMNTFGLNFKQIRQYIQK